MTSKIVFVGIDGTGDSNHRTYDKAFTWSYVRAIYDRIPTEHKKYLRGPATLGTTTMSLADKAVHLIKRERTHYNQSHGKSVSADQLKVCLAGYSRGGAAAVFAARKLELLSIPVDYLILFDAVDRSPSFADSIHIPTNVLQVWHAMRHPAAASREIFGHTATHVNPGTAYEQHKCMTTHGGMGGTPWCNNPDLKTLFKSVKGQASSKWKEKIWESDFKIGKLKIEDPTNLTFEEDLIGSQLAWKWMVSKLGRLGIRHRWPLAGVRDQLENGNLTRR